MVYRAAATDRLRDLDDVGGEEADGRQPVALVDGVGTGDPPCSEPEQRFGQVRLGLGVQHVGHRGEPEQSVAAPGGGERPVDVALDQRLGILTLGDPLGLLLQTRQRPIALEQARSPQLDGYLPALVLVGDVPYDPQQVPRVLPTELCRRGDDYKLAVGRKTTERRGGNSELFNDLKAAFARGGGSARGW